MFSCDFNKNEGYLDRVVRISVGLVVLIMSILNWSGSLQLIGFAVGALLVSTGVVGWCFLYSLLNISTIFSTKSTPVSIEVNKAKKKVSKVKTAKKKKNKK